MKKIFLKNQKGLGLVEMITVIVISSIIIVFAATAIITFFVKYRELSLYSELQQSGLEAIETLKYGYHFPEPYDVAFLGIVNANSARLQTVPGSWGQYAAIRCVYDRTREGHANDYVRFYWDRNSRSIRMEALYGPQYFSEVIFPRENQDNIEVTKFNLIPHPDAERPGIIRLEMEAHINITEDKIRRISYSTNIAIGRRL